MIRSRKAWVLRVVCPLLAGGLAYALLRPLEATFLGGLLETGPAGYAVPAVGRVLAPLLRQMPAWILYSLPDALWCYACVSMVLLLWRSGPPLLKAFWLGAAVLLGLGFEVGQLTRFVPGTYCTGDLWLSLAAVFTALLPWPDRDPGMTLGSRDRGGR